MRKFLLLGVAGVLFVVLVLLGVAGLLTLTDPGSPAEDGVPVRGGSLDTNQTALWEWTQSAVGRDVEGTPFVTIDDLGGFDERREQRVRGFERRLLAAGASDDAGRPIAALAYPSPLSIALDEAWLPETWNRTTRSRVNATLVHEFTHLVQFRTDAYTETRRILGSEGDRGRTLDALTEGGASFVEDAYAEESRRESLASAWRDPALSPGARYSLWTYYRGLEYFEARIDDPRALWSIYHDPPRTTATILRGEAPLEEPPLRHVRTMDLAGYDVADRGRVGAGFVEVLLAAGVGPERTREVATGWEWDGLRTVRPMASGPSAADAPGHVWITEWSSTAAADGFESGLSAYLDDHWEASSSRWSLGEGTAARIERVDGDAVALVLGPAAVLDDVVVSAEGDGYAIEPPAVSGSSTTPRIDAGPRAPVVV